MDSRTALKKGSILHFPGMECVIDASVGRGSNAIAYTGSYRDQQNPDLSHRVLIRELFPFDPAGGITRAADDRLIVVPSSRQAYDFNRMTFLRGNEVHVCLSKTIPSDIDVNINTFEYNDTLYSLIGYNGGRTLDRELSRSDMRQRSSSDESAKRMEKLLWIIRILKGALSVLESFHEAGYLHLDISPDNILLIGEGDKERVTLIDYNSVHTLQEIRGRQSIYYSTKEGYTAPEVQMGRISQIRECTDLYSMTAVLYHCLTGSRLTPLQVIGTEPVCLPLENSALLTGCPESALSMLRRILRKGLAVLPRRRYSRAWQMLKDLTELEDRITGRGITHWALWESGRARIRRALQENTALDYLLDERKIYPVYAETEDGRRISLLQNTWIDEETQRKPDNVSQKTGLADPILLLGGGGMGKTTALFRLSYVQSDRYTPVSTAVYYISLYGYRDKNPHYICDRLLESLKFKPHTDSMETARRELMQLLDRPLPLSADNRSALLLLLDGLNEAAGDTAPLLEEIHTLSGLAGVQIILTGRSDPGDPLFRKLVLCRLEQAEVRRILSEEGILPPENMEIFDLLSFPMILSMYIQTVRSGEKQLRLESREQLLEDYFDAILEKDRRNLPAEGDFFMGTEAAVRYLLPEIAALSAKKQHSLTAQDLMPMAEKCYKELSHRAVTAVFPEWIGHTAGLRMGASNADEWYGKAVLEILWKRMGLLVRDEEGGFRILHQIIEEYLLEKSRHFHEIFDLEKRRQRRWGIMAAVLAVLFAALSFGVYNYSMRKQIQQREQEALRNESLSLAYSSETKLDGGDRKGALRDAERALPSKENIRPFVPEAEYALTRALYAYEGDRYHPVQTLSWENEAEKCVLSQDGTHFVMLDNIGRMSCYETASGKILWSRTVPYAGNSSVTYDDLYGQKMGYRKIPQAALPLLYIDAQNKTVLCAGETKGAALFSVATGETLWELSYESAAGTNAVSDESSGSDQRDQDPVHASAAVVSGDGKTFALAVEKRINREDSGTQTIGKILFCDMDTGKITADSGILETSHYPEWSFTGAGGFQPYSSSPAFYTSIHFEGNDTDWIISFDPETGEVTLGPSVSGMNREEGGSVSQVFFLPQIVNEDGETVHREGLFYYTCTYAWDVVKGFTGKAVVSFAPGYGKQWSYSHEIDFLPEANVLPEIIRYNGSVFLISGNVIVRLDEEGKEDRFYLEKNIVYIARPDSNDSAQERILLLTEDGSIRDFSLYSMNYDSRIDSDDYPVVRRNLISSAGSGIRGKPFCVLPEDNSKSGILCELVEDKDKIVIHDPDSEVDIRATGYLYVIPDGFLYIYTRATAREDGSYKSDAFGYVYDAAGELRDRFTFVPEKYTSMFKLQVTQDGSFLFGDNFIYDLKRHSMKKLSDLMPELETPYSVFFRSAAMGNDVLSAFWNRDSLTVWKNGEQIINTAPDEYDYFPSFILVNSDYDSNIRFHDLTTGENGLIIIAGSNSTFTDHKKLIGEYSSTSRGKGFTTDYYLVYSVDTNEWSRIENCSETPGFPILCTAENHKWFASMDEDDRILVYDASSGQVRSSIQTDTPQQAVKEMKFIENDEYILLLSGSLNLTYQIIRIGDGKTVYTWHPEQSNPISVRLIVQEDPEAGRLYITSSDGSMSGVCIDTENWVTLFEAPAMCGMIGKDSFVQMNYINAMQIQPVYPLDKLQEMAKGILENEKKNE